MGLWKELWSSWGSSPISQLTIKHNGKTYALQVEDGDYTDNRVQLGSLKRKLAAKLDVPAENLTVWSTDAHKQMQLKDDKRTLEDYNIKNKATLLVIGEKPKPLTPADHVAAAVNLVEEELGLRIKEFCANPPNTEKEREKEFLVLNEVILQNILKLDNIETDGDAELRTMRKQAINKLQKYHSEIDQANKRSLELPAAQQGDLSDTPASTEAKPDPALALTARDSTPESSGKKKKKSKGKGKKR